MKCNRFLGHKWSQWVKRTAQPNDKYGYISRQVYLVRRCALCGYIEEQWMNSHHVVTKEEDSK